MSSLRVKGGVQLSGEITPQGAKNEALQVICATLLSDSDIIISNNYQKICSINYEQFKYIPEKILNLIFNI